MWQINNLPKYALLKFYTVCFRNLKIPKHGTHFVRVGYWVVPIYLKLYFQIYFGAFKISSSGIGFTKVLTFQKNVRNCQTFRNIPKNLINLKDDGSLTFANILQQSKMFQKLVLRHHKIDTTYLEF